MRWQHRTHPSRHRALKPPTDESARDIRKLGAAGFRAVRWLSARLFAAAGFHQLGSAFADAADRACPRKAWPRRDGVSRGARPARYPQFGRGAGRGNAGRRTAPDRQQRGRTLFRQQAHHRISAPVDRRRGRDAARHRPRHRRYRRLADQLGLPDTSGHHRPLGAGGSAAEPETAAHHGGRRLRRPPARPDDPHAKDPRTTAWACRARAADLPAAP